jgi:hypothetical protein
VPLQSWLDAVGVLDCRDDDVQPVIEKLVKAVLGVDSGDGPDSDSVLRLANVLNNVQPERVSTRTWISIAVTVLRPTFRSSYLSPEKLNQVVMTTYKWPSSYARKLYDTVADGIKRYCMQAGPDSLELLVALMNEWLNTSEGEKSSLDTRLNDERSEVDQYVSRELAATVAPYIKSPALRSHFNRAASELSISLHEPDPLFAVLTESPDYSRDWAKRRDEANQKLDNVLSSLFGNNASLLMHWLASNKDELIAVNDSGAIWRVMSRLVYMHPDASACLMAAIDHNLGRYAGVITAKCLEDSTLTMPMVVALLADTSARGALISTALHYCRDLAILAVLVRAITRDDVRALSLSHALHGCTDFAREMLLAHDDLSIRSDLAAMYVAAHDQSDPGLMPKDVLLALTAFDTRSSVIREHERSEALAWLSEHSPSIYIPLLVRHAEQVEAFDAFSEWEQSARALSGEDRTSVWTQVRLLPVAANAFWLLAAGDEAWLHKTLREAAFPVPLRQLLYSTRFQYGRQFGLKGLAVALRPLLWEPIDLLWTMDIGLHVGGEAPRYERYIEECKELEESSDQDLAELGRQGVKLYGDKLQEALIRAKRAAIRGYAS